MKRGWLNNFFFFSCIYAHFIYHESISHILNPISHLQGQAKFQLNKKHFCSHLILIISLLLICPRDSYFQRNCSSFHLHRTPHTFYLNKIPISIIFTIYFWLEFIISAWILLLLVFGEAEGKEIREFPVKTHQKFF